MPWKKSKQMYLRWTFDGHEVLCLLTQHSFFCLTVKPPQRAKTFSTHFNLKLTMRYDFSTLTAALLVSVAVVLVLVPSSMGRNDEPRDNDLRRTFGVQKRASEGHGSRPASPEHPAPAWHEHPTWNHPDLFKPNARLWSSPSTSPERFRPGQTTKSPGKYLAPINEQARHLISKSYRPT